MGAFVLIVYLKLAYNLAPTMAMQEFDSKETCQAAGTKLWELSGRETNWSCIKK